RWRERVCPPSPGADGPGPGPVAHLALTAATRPRFGPPHALSQSAGCGRTSDPQGGPPALRPARLLSEKPGHLLFDHASGLGRHDLAVAGIVFAQPGDTARAGRPGGRGRERTTPVHPSGRLQFGRLLGSCGTASFSAVKSAAPKPGNVKRLSPS